MYRNYKEHTSNYKTWEQKSHAEEYLLYPQNVGTKISIDEVALTQGELYTIVTNKSAKGKKGSLVAIIEGTRTEDITSVLDLIQPQARQKIEEVTLDMAKNMEAAVRQSFSKAKLVTDHFHVVRLVSDALQHIRIKYRWQAIDQENKAIKEAKNMGAKYLPKIYPNGDTPKQLLARSKYLLYKYASSWTLSQSKRAEILFKEYPILKQAYEKVNQFRNIFSNKCKHKAEAQFKQWFQEVSELNLEQFNTAVYSLQYHFESILNFFNHRSTNASAESFNAKLKGFRAILKGVSDPKFFLFRLEKLFA